MSQLAPSTQLCENPAAAAGDAAAGKVSHAASQVQPECEELAESQLPTAKEVKKARALGQGGVVAVALRTADQMESVFSRLDELEARMGVVQRSQCETDASVDAAMKAVSNFRGVVSSIGGKHLAPSPHSQSQREPHHQLARSLQHASSSSLLPAPQAFTKMCVSAGAAVASAQPLPAPRGVGERCKQQHAVLAQLRIEETLADHVADGHVQMEALRSDVEKLQRRLDRLEVLREEEEVAAAAMGRNGCKSTQVWDAWGEASDLSVAAAQKSAAVGSGSSAPFFTSRAPCDLSEQVRGVIPKVNNLCADMHEVCTRLKHQEERLRAVRTRMDAIDEKVQNEGVERSDWEGRLRSCQRNVTNELARLGTSELDFAKRIGELQAELEVQSQRLASNFDAARLHPVASMATDLRCLASRVSQHERVLADHEFNIARLEGYQAAGRELLCTAETLAGSLRSSTLLPAATGARDGCAPSGQPREFVEKDGRAFPRMREVGHDPSDARMTGMVKGHAHDTQRQETEAAYSPGGVEQIGVAGVLARLVALETGLARVHLVQDASPKLSEYDDSLRELPRQACADGWRPTHSETRR